MEMRVPNRHILLGRVHPPCKRNAKKAKKAKKAKRLVGSGEGDKVQESLAAASVLASSVSDGVLSDEFRGGMGAISETIRGGSFEIEVGEMLQQDDLNSIVRRVNRVQLNTVVFKFTQLLNKIQLALKINRCASQYGI